jgi:hypothetical protein
MNQALYAHMNNKRKRKKKLEFNVFSSQIYPQHQFPLVFELRIFFWPLDLVIYSISLVFLKILLNLFLPFNFPNTKCLDVLHFNLFQTYLTETVFKEVFVGVYYAEVKYVIVTAEGWEVGRRRKLL